jgi:lysophospholipase L1-like esterase
MLRQSKPSNVADKSKLRPSWSNRVILAAITLSVVLVIILLGGLAYGAYAASGHSVSGRKPALAKPSGTRAGDKTDSSGESQAPQHKAIYLVALGDSLTYGFGDASGSGFVGDVVAHLRQQGGTVAQTNLGIDGLTSSGLVEQLKQTQVARSLREANVILISIGGNDLNNAAGLPSIHPTKIAAAEKKFNYNLRYILQAIRGLNSQAPILLIGLYNPYGDIVQTRVQTDNIVASWNTDEMKIADGFQPTVVVQTYDLFQFDPGKFLYIDHFHPNQAGYNLIANRIWQDLQGTSQVIS